MYAILNDRGHQYKVREGDLVHVDKLGGKKGDAIAFDQVLLVGQDDGSVKVGAPTVAGAKVTGVVEEDLVKGEKLIAHHRVMTNSLGRRRGHRTQYTVIRINKIQA